MRRSIIISLLAASALAVSACGTDESAGGLAKSFAKNAKKEGLDVEESCVKDVFSKLDADGLKELAKFAKDDKAKVEEASAAIQEVVGNAIGCTGALSDKAVDEMVKAMAAGMPGADEACIRDVVKGFDGDTLKKLLEVNSSGDASQAGDLMQKLMPCVPGG